MRTHRLLLVLLFVLALVASACGSSGNGSTPAAAGPAASTAAIAEPTTVATSEPTTTPIAAPTSAPQSQPAEPLDLADERVVQVVRSLAKAYQRTNGVWKGFVPNDHPVVVAIKNADDTVSGLVAINHPAADALGDATPLSTDGLPFQSLFHITNPVDADELQALASFDFHAQLGGVDTFAIIAGGSDEFFDPEHPDWAATFVHELFHRYQDQAFAPDTTAQDVEGYAYTPENLALAALEERALSAALSAETDDARLLAARHVAGIRLARLAADDRVVLDQTQERYEGTARLIEHRFASDDTAYTYHGGNFDREFPNSLTSDVKDTFGFGRFYATGAAILRLAALTGVDDAALTTRIEAGEAPAALLADHLNVTLADAADLVAQARDAYDPGNEVEALGVAAADAAAAEPSIFGDDGGEDVSSSDAIGASDTDPDSGTPIELTPEELACINSSEIPANGILPDEVWEKCVGK